MSWELARLAMKCGIRNCAIAVGDPIRRGTVVTSVVWCASCAERGGHGTPPARLDFGPAAAPPLEAAPAPDPQPALFGVEPDGPRYRHAEARREVERVRDSLEGGQR